MMAGASRPAASSAIRSIVADAVRWDGSVPCDTTAAGVSAERPLAISRSAIRGSERTPIRNTSVPGVAASPAQSMLDSGRLGSSCPVTTVT